MKEKFKEEEENQRKVSEKLDRLILDENDLNKIIREIKNAKDDKRRDKFTKKYAFVVQSAIYSNNTGLNDLHQTKKDMQNILETIAELGIKPDNIIKVVDSGWDNIESQFKKVTEIIRPHVEILIENTWTGNQKGCKGILWKNLKDIALSLID